MSQERTGPTGPTGTAEADAVVASMSSLDELPLEEHAAAFDSAHTRLRAVLDDVHDPA